MIFLFAILTSRCWVQDDKEGWVGAEVVAKNVNDDKITLTLKLENGSEKSIDTTLAALEQNSDTLPPLRNPPVLETTEDLTTLSHLNEPSVLHAIRMRYAQLDIYTYSGIVLIATNPFQKVDNLYTPDIIQLYSGTTRGERDPHLFAIAEDAYRCMLRDNKNQTIVVSGESGAGKTVSAKYIMRYFATVEDPEHPRKHHSAGSGSKAGINLDALSATEEQILATNPIMEAFGNAKTTRNDNSSRFGKYLEIQFDKEVEIIGAKIRTYLLERSRLVFQPSTERNYHIFYQLCCGATDSEREEFRLLPVGDFFYLSQGGDPVIANVDDAEEFRATRAALKTIGIGEDIQHDVFKVLSGLLHIGNIQIQATRTQAVLSSDEPSLLNVCELLGLDATTFAKWLVRKQITTRSEKIVSNLDHKQSIVVRDSVAKYIYSSLFDWLVDLINTDLVADEAKGSRVNSFIGVLDIYGFEHFEKNSFEQFCINYANEKLQQEFNQHVFKLEQDEYVKEEIEWTFIDFSDNQPCITLIEAKLGILGLLDEESRLPAGSDDGWINKLYQSFDKPDHNRFFKKPRFGNTSFIVSHYAMDVSYEAEGFIEKNRDTVPDEIVELLQATTNPFLKKVLDRASETAQAAAAEAQLQSTSRTIKRKPTLGSIFKGSLIELMATINSTNVHYIRCIKPNEEKAAWKFHGPMVLSQLRACGVLETIRISCAGFPTRWTYEEFASRYYMLVRSDQWTSNIQKLCDTILQKSIPTDDKYQLGKTKIFFRAGMLAYLEKLRGDRLHECAIILQKNLRMVYYRKKYLAIRESIVRLQSLVRGYSARVRYENDRQTKAAVIIQKRWRGYSARCKFLQTRANVITIQAHMRGFMLRRRILEERYDAAAKTIQNAWRGFSARQKYAQHLRKIVIVQSLVRRRLAIKELKQLRVEAKSLNKIKEVQYQLENKVIELTQSLATRQRDNKKLEQTIDQLQNQISQWKKRHGEIESRLAETVAESDEVKAALETELVSIKQDLAAAQKEHADLSAKFAKEIEENKTLRDAIADKDAKILEASNSLKNYEEEHINFTNVIAQLRADLEGANDRLAQSTAAMSIPAMRMLDVNGHPGHQTSPKKRNLKRKSLTMNSATPFDDTVGPSPRPASVMISNTNGLHTRRLSTSTDISMGSTGYNGEIERLLEDEKTLYSEVITGLIVNLKIAPPSSNEKITHKEVLFPANIINLITSEMWRLGYLKESASFLARVMDSIQQSIVKRTGEDIINPGAFWLSNIHEMFSFICLAEANIKRNQVVMDDMSEDEYHEYERLVDVVKNDLESLEFNVYHAWMKELKKLLDRMIVPAIVLAQSLPGFVTQENSRFNFGKIFNPSNTPQPTMDDLLSLFNKIYKAMDAYYLEPAFRKQPIVELLKMVGTKSFNDFIVRRNFLSWKRGLQINYNITRVEEWCKSHGVEEGTLRLEHMMQSTKLLQLKKSTVDDIDIIYDICWSLTPVQIQKLVSAYSTADYEEPIPNDILNAVAAKVKNDNGKGELLLESCPIDDSGPFEIMEPRVLKRIESYIPGWVQVPHLRRLAELTAAVNAQNESMMQESPPSQDLSQIHQSKFDSAESAIEEEYANGEEADLGEAVPI